MHSLLTSLSLLLLLGSPSRGVCASAALVQDEDKAFEALERSFDDAALAWRKEVRAAQKAKDAAAEAALDATNPVKDFYARFAALEESGSANAALWMATRVENVETDAEKIPEQKQRLFAHAIRGLGATKAAEDILRALKKQDEFLAAPARSVLPRSRPPRRTWRSDPAHGWPAARACSCAQRPPRSASRPCRRSRRS
jgi:hypothetical protein